MDAGPSASSATLPTRVAGPLPVKRGEIGYDPTSPTESNSPANDDQIIVLPERHPADRDSPHPTSAHSPTRTLSVNQPDTPTTPKGAEAQGFIYGFRTTQVALLSVLLVIIIATVVAWAALGNLLNRNKIPALTGYGSVVVHVIFAVFLITQLIFFERRLYFARAQRFARLHPNALADPTADVCPSTLAPWARPPLPTYAATLAQSGVGTGDVEDHIIAAPPPPAYGNTRGSKLLLSGFLTETMRRERPVSTISTQSRPGDRLNVPQGGERPLSYRSHDEQWEEYCDAQRARILEDTLATLERPASTLIRTR